MPIGDMIYPQVGVASVAAAGLRNGSAGTRYSAPSSQTVVVNTTVAHDREAVRVVGVVEHLDSTLVTPPVSIAPADIDHLCERTVALASEGGAPELLTARWAFTRTGVRLVTVTSSSSSSTRLLAAADGDRITVAYPVAEGHATGTGSDLGRAFAAAMSAAGTPLPLHGRVFLSIGARDRRLLSFPARTLVDLGFDLLASDEIARLLNRFDVPTGAVSERHAIELIHRGNVQLVVNTDSQSRLRSAAHRVPLMTGLAELVAAVQGIQHSKDFGGPNNPGPGPVHRSARPMYCPPPSPGGRRR
jgi:hypothetical protein